MLTHASLLLLVLASATTNPAAAATGQFLEREISLGGESYRYQVFVPLRHDDRAKLPVILFLHGSGERGDDGMRQTQAGLGPYVRKHATEFPALVVFPQSPEGRSWEGEIAKMALAALDASVQEFGGDPDRITLTGMSRGGYGTYSLAMMKPDKFAALVPICGGITSPRHEEPLQVSEVLAQDDPFAAAAARLKHIPTWIFHGAKDDVVPPQQSRKMFAALKAAGGDVRYTELSDANHNSWDAAYRDEGMWSWLFAQRLR